MTQVACEISGLDYVHSYSLFDARAFDVLIRLRSPPVPVIVKAFAHPGGWAWGSRTSWWSTKYQYLLLRQLTKGKTNRIKRQVSSGQILEFICRDFMDMHALGIVQNEDDMKRITRSALGSILKP